MHPLDQLRLRLSGPSGGYILHRSIGQGHPSRVIQRQSWLTFEKLPEHYRITIRGTVISRLIQPLCKFRQGLLVLPQRITQMPQHLRYSDEHCCLAVLTSQSTNQLLLLCELQIGFGVLHIFFGKDGCKFLLKIASIQAREGRCDLQKGDDLASCLLYLRQQLHIHGTGVHTLNQLVQHIAGSIQIFNGAVRDVQHLAANGSCGHGTPLIGHGVLPEIQRQNRMVDDLIHLPLLSCFFIFIIAHNKGLVMFFENSLSCH